MSVSFYQVKKSPFSFLINSIYQVKKKKLNRIILKKPIPLSIDKIRALMLSIKGQELISALIRDIKHQKTK